MKKEITKITEQLKTINGDSDLLNLLSRVESLIQKDQSNISLLHLRAELFIKLQKPAKAINDFNEILIQDPTDTTAIFQVEHLKTILKFNNTDIYANPNTNLDPWLD